MLANYIAVLVGYLAITLGSACNYVAITGCASIDMSDPSSSDCPCLACDYPLTVSGDSTSCCTAADANCLTCDASSNCQTCVSNYFVDSGNVCALCSSQIPNCLTCSSVASGCTTCNAGYVINLSNACVHCSD
jgi:proprotein convertase subtilisin/kexin type 5